MCKQCTDYEGYSTVVIKERPPEEENVLDKELGVKHVFVRKKDVSFFLCLPVKRRGFLLNNSYSRMTIAYIFEVFDIDRNPTGRDILADRTDLDIVFV